MSRTNTGARRSASGAGRKPAEQRGMRFTAETTDVVPGKPFSLPVTLINTTRVIDAFSLTVLGLDATAVKVQPEVASLFPAAEETVSLQVTLPPGFPVGPCSLMLKKASATDPSVQCVEPLRLRVAAVPAATMVLDPGTATGGRTGRYSLTLSNTGNAPMDISLSGDDGENHFAFLFQPDGVIELPAGTTRSVQAVISGPRAFTGAPMPRQFTIVGTSPGHEMKVVGALAQRPYVPRLALMLAMIGAMFGLWGLVVGSAISAVMKDSKSDVAAAMKDGMTDVAEGLKRSTDGATATEQARIEALDAAAGTSNDLGLSGSGVSTNPADASGTSDGTGGGTADGAAALAAAAPPDALVGLALTASDGRPIAGASVTARAVLEEGSLKGRPDPNRNPTVATSVATGRFQLLNLPPGLYNVTFSAPGYLDTVCSTVRIPTTRPSLSGCRSDGAPVDPGPGSEVKLLSKLSSIAGIVTAQGEPVEGATVTARRLDTVLGYPTDVIEPSVTGADGRFTFAFLSAAKLAPGTFELLAVREGFVNQRSVVVVAVGGNSIGLEVALTRPVPAATTTLPAAQRGLSGQVCDGSQPLKGVVVQLTGGTRSLSLVTLPDGSWEVDGLEGGRYNVSFSKPGYSPAAQRLQVPSSGGSCSVALVKSPVAISGRVVGPTGIGLANVKVTDTGGTVLAVSGADGAWRTSQTYGEGEVRLTFRPADTGLASTTVFVQVRPPNGEQIVPVQLGPSPPAA